MASVIAASASDVFEVPLPIAEVNTVDPALELTDFAGDAFILSELGEVWKSTAFGTWNKPFANQEGRVESLLRANGYLCGLTESGVYFSTDGDFWSYADFASFDEADYELSAKGNFFVLETEIEGQSTFQVTKNFETYSSLPNLPDVVVDGIRGGFGDTLLLTSGFTTYDSFFASNESGGWDELDLPATGTVASFQEIAGELFTFVITESEVVLYKTNDLANWENIALPDGFSVVSDEPLRKAGELWFLEGSYVSSDGLETWTELGWEFPVRDIRLKDEQFLGVGSAPGGDGVVLKSLDGLIWEVASPASNSANGVNSIAVADWGVAHLTWGIGLGGSVSMLRASGDLESWEIVSEGELHFSDYLGVTEFGKVGDFYLLSNRDGKFVSSDLKTWEPTEFPEAAFGSVFGNGVYLSTTGSDTRLAKLLISSNLVNWTSFEVHPLVEFIPSIEYFDRVSMFFFVSGDGELWRSSDGKNWSRPDITGAESLSMLHSAGEYLFAFASGVWSRSEDGEIWVPVSAEVEFPQASIFRYSNGRYFSGLFASADGLSWQVSDLPAPTSPRPYEIIPLEVGFLALGGSNFITADGVVWKEVSGIPELPRIEGIDGRLFGIGSDVYELLDLDEAASRLEAQEGHQFKITWRPPAGSQSVLVGSDDLVEWSVVDEFPAYGLPHAFQANVSFSGEDYTFYRVEFLTAE